MSGCVTEGLKTIEAAPLCVEARLETDVVIEKITA